MSFASVTVSVVSHGHGDEVNKLLADLVLFCSVSVAVSAVTINIPDPELLIWIKEIDWPFDVEVLENIHSLGYGANHNQAFEYCRTPFFVILKPDIRLTGSTFPDLLEAVKQDQVGCAYPLQKNEKGDPRDVARELPTPLALMRRYLWPSRWKKPEVFDWTNGAFMFFRAKFFKGMGGFDARYFMYFEDVDLCLRIKLRRKKIFLMNSIFVQHAVHRLTRRNIKHFIGNYRVCGVFGHLGCMWNTVFMLGWSFNEK